MFCDPLAARRIAWHDGKRGTLEHGLSQAKVKYFGDNFDLRHDRFPRHIACSIGAFWLL
jgi:hypothetical protein